MIKKIFISLLILFSMISCVSGDIQLNYTDTFDTYNTIQTSNNETYQLYTDNSFDILTIYQATVMLPGTYYNNVSFMIYDHTYKVENKYIVTSSLVPILYNIEHITTVYNDDVFRSEQIYEYKTYKICTSTFKNQMFLGTYQKTDEIGNKIYMEQLISSWSGIEKYFTYVCDIEQNDLSNIRTLKIEKNIFSSLVLAIDYKKTGTYTEKYYVNQLSEPLQYLYKGLKIVDSDKTILNVLLLSDYVLNIVFYILGIITKSFFTLFFLFLIAGIPTIAFSNSRTQQDFINKCIGYYISTFKLMISFLKYIINIGIYLISIILPF